DVAGKEEPHRPGAVRLGDLHLDGGRAEEMAGIPEAGLRALRQGEPLAPGNAPELPEAGAGIADIIDRLDRRPVAAGIPPVELLDLERLDMGRIGKHDAS